MPNLFKRDGVWYAWVKDRNGKTVKRSTGCTTREAAERTVPRLELEAADPAYAAANRTTTQEVLDDYYRSRQRLGRAEGTLHHVRIKAGALLGLLPPVAAEITHVKLLAYVDKRLAEGARRTTAKKELRVLKAALRLARRNGKWYGDPDAVIPELEDDYEPRKRALTPWELIALVNQLEKKRAAMVAFIVATSARWGEAMRADLEADIWRPQHQETVYVRLRGTKTKASERTVPMHGARLDVLRWVLKRAVFFAPWPNVRRDLAAACRRAGIEPVTPNDLRRTFATWLREAGAEPSTIGAAMGHVDSRMVERVYGRLQPEALGRLLEQQTKVLPVASAGDGPERDRTPSSERPLMSQTRHESEPNTASGALAREVKSAGRYASYESPETAPSDGSGATSVASKTLENPCAGTESNCRHGDFQSGPPDDYQLRVFPGVWNDPEVRTDDVWSIHGSFFAGPVPS